RTRATAPRERSGPRQVDGEARATGVAALDGEAPPVGDDDRARDGQAQAAAATLAVAGGVQAHERLEDPRGVARIDAGAGVLDGHHDLAADLGHRDLDAAA